MTTRRTSRAKEELALRLRADGLSYQAIGDRLGVTPMTAFNIVKRGKDAPRIQHRGIAPKKKAEVIQLYIEGNSVKSIAQSVGVSSPTVRKILRDAGQSSGQAKKLKIQEKKPRQRGHNYELVRKGLQQGLSRAQISQLLGISKQRVSQITISIRKEIESK